MVEGAQRRPTSVGRATLRARSRGRGILIAASTFAAGLCAAPLAAEPPLEAFFRAPQLTRFKMSPDGAHVAALSSEDDIWRVAVIRLDPMKIVSEINARRREIFDFWWVHDDRLLLSVSYDGGREARLVGANREGDAQDLSQAIVRAGGSPSSVEFLHPLPQQKSAVLVEFLWRATPALVATEVARLNANTGNFSVVAGRATRGFEWLVDPAGELRVGSAQTHDDSFYLIREPGGIGFQRLEKLGELGLDFENFAPQGFPSAEGPLVVASRHAGDHFSLYTFDTKTRVISEAFYANPEVDVAGPAVRARTGQLLGVGYQEDVWKVRWLEPSWQKRAELLQRSFPGVSAHIVSWDDAAARFVVLVEADRRPPIYALYEEKTRAVRSLASLYPELPAKELAPTRRVSYSARDGLTIPAYLTLPAEGKGALPVVVIVHDGPWTPDSTIRMRSGRVGSGFDSEAQFFASRGYAVLRPNYRGSVGYGLEYERAGYGRWGAEMQDDLSDGVRWLIAEGIADARRICIFGKGYGGFAAALALAETPDLYRCGIAYNGIYDLPSFSSQIDWYIYDEQILRRIGNDADAQAAASPARRAEAFRAPLLLARGDQGGAGWVWIEAQFDAMADALEQAGKPFERVELKDDGQGLRREANRLRFYGAVEKFLSQHLTVPDDG